MRKIFWIFMLLPSIAFAANKSFNSKEPIEITSDSLEVQQTENKATFIGNVVAIQQDVRLKSDKMTVYYAPSDDKSAPAKTDDKKSGTSQQKQNIKKIEVDGNVFLSTPEETASGERGDYDVEGNEIHLYDNVVLTRGANTLKGNQLTYNFATGYSVVTGGAVAEKGASAGKQRVRALFVPDQKPKAP
jgi:lipopolysaccharide export system protein LptA